MIIGWTELFYIDYVYIKRMSQPDVQIIHEQCVTRWWLQSESRQLTLRRRS